jgi:hypothetical protein
MGSSSPPSRLRLSTDDRPRSGWFDKTDSEAIAHSEFQQTPHKASATHELLAGAAAFEVRFRAPDPMHIWRGSQAAQAYEKHCKENGQPQDHAVAKELVAGFVGAFFDREMETVGVCAFPVRHVPLIDPLLGR